MRKTLMAATAILAVTSALFGCAALQEGVGGILEGGASGEDGLGEDDVIAGLREALRIGTENTVGSTSRLDGYLGNELIRIAMPEELEPIASTLRAAGLGAYVDELETGMNRAAELAASEAREVFWDAIMSMSIQDAFGILEGGDTAATEYFRERTWSEIKGRFHPIIEGKMDEIGLSRLYSRFSDAYYSIPLTGTPALVDLDEYVTDRALDGLFTMLALEERKIREDPAARTTDLLRRVFGS